MERNNEMKNLVIIGNTEFAEIAYEYFTYDSEYEVVGFAVEKPYIKSEYLKGKPVVDFAMLPQLYPPNEYYVFTAITYQQLNRLRERFYMQCKEWGYQFATYISSAAFIWKNNVEIGENCFIFENNTVQYNVHIGNNVVLWSGNHIGHSAQISDNCFISSHVVVSGYCNIGKNCFLGVNATMGNDILLPEDSLLAAGAVMTHSFADVGCILAGNPAKKVSKSAYEYYGVKEKEICARGGRNAKRVLAKM